jgi:hypothetical protein
MKGRKKERKNRKMSESTLQHDEERSSEDAIAGVRWRMLITTMCSASASLHE